MKGEKFIAVASERRLNILLEEASKREEGLRKVVTAQKGLASRMTWLINPIPFKFKGRAHRLKPHGDIQREWTRDSNYEWSWVSLSGKDFFEVLEYLDGIGEVS